MTKDRIILRAVMLVMITLLFVTQLSFICPVGRSAQLLSADINGDGTVDIFDAIIIASKFGTTPQTPNWDPKADLNHDNIVDILDVILLAKSFGQTYSPLEEMAYEEGSLTIYGVIDYNDMIRYIIPAFVNDYPWASGKINYNGMPPYQVTGQAISEYQANHVQADVLINTLGSLTPALEIGVAQKWTNPMISLMNYTFGTYAINGQWDPCCGIPIVVVYKPNLVNSSMVPTTWFDLTDPFWNNKIVIDDPKTINIAGSVFADLYPRFGNATWTALMRGIAANHPIITTSAGDSFVDLVSGQGSICIALIYDYLAGLAQLPTNSIAIAPIEPLTCLPIPSALCTNAPHPNFAKLFLEWLASPSGQRAIVSTGRFPMQYPNTVDTRLNAVLPPQLTDMTSVAYNNPDYYINPSSWATTYQAIFG